MRSERGGGWETSVGDVALWSCTTYLDTNSWENPLKPCRLCESVAASLTGQRLGSFTRVTTAVTKAVEEALTRILTPHRSIDVLREVKATQAQGQPYMIVFVGVNGVGKSTNLAKVAYWLLQHNMKVCAVWRVVGDGQLNPFLTSFLSLHPVAQSCLPPHTTTTFSTPGGPPTCRS